LQISDLGSRLFEQGYGVTVNPAARRILIEKGWDPKYGGRPLRRAVQKELEDPLSALLLADEYPAGTVFSAEGRNGKISVKLKRSGETGGAVGDGAAGEATAGEKALANNGVLAGKEAR
jgi:ATP-dependent Clp protease ATP-binding subunit ClpC